MKNIGKYQVTEVIGKGAMGIVYKAVDPDINREVAIKTINFDLLSDDINKDELIKRFIKEAQAAGKLTHPNIITIYDVVKEDNMTYIVMQYIEGESLKKVIDDVKPLSSKQISILIKRVGSALDYAHQNGIVHRDIKPANILIDSRGNPYILDFGVARIETSNLTQTGTVVGTPSYMSPEQIKGKKVDNRSDIFSLGIILYELITGIRPFQGENISTIVYKIVNEEPPELQEMKKNLPEAYGRVIKKAMEKDPSKRYQSCSQMVADLLGQKEPSESTMSMDLSDMDPVVHKRIKRRKTGLILAAVLCAAALVSIIALIPILKDKYSVPPPEEEQSQSTVNPKSQVVSKPEVTPPQKKPNKPAPQTLMPRLKSLFESGDYEQAETLAKEILADNPNFVEAKNYLDRSQEQLRAGRLATQIEARLRAGKSAWEQGDYTRCLTEMQSVLKLQSDHNEALDYSKRVRAAVSSEEGRISQVIERQRKAEETKDLLTLLSDIGSDSLNTSVKQDSTLLFNGYDNIQSRISNIRIEVSSAGRATASYDKLLTGDYKATGERSILYQGKITLTLQKQGDSWKITNRESS